MNNFNHLTVTFSAENSWGIAFLWMPFDMHHLSKHHPRPSTLPNSNGTPFSSPLSRTVCIVTPHCSGMVWGTWQRARGIDIASKSPISQSDQAFVGHAEQVWPTQAKDSKDPMQMPWWRLHRTSPEAKSNPKLGFHMGPGHLLNLGHGTTVSVLWCQARTTPWGLCPFLWPFQISFCAFRAGIILLGQVTAIRECHWCEEISLLSNSLSMSGASQLSSIQRPGPLVSQKNTRTPKEDDQRWTLYLSVVLMYWLIGVWGTASVSFIVQQMIAFSKILPLI